MSDYSLSAATARRSNDDARTRARQLLGMQSQINNSVMRPGRSSLSFAQARQPGRFIGNQPRRSIQQPEPEHSNTYVIHHDDAAASSSATHPPPRPRPGPAGRPPPAAVIDVRTGLPRPTIASIPAGPRAPGRDAGRQRERGRGQGRCDNIPGAVWGRRGLRRGKQGLLNSGDWRFRTSSGLKSVSRSS